MNPRGSTSQLRMWCERIQQSARLMCGVGDYDAYVEHMRKTHPDRTPLTYEAFFRERQDVRYGKSAARCC